MSANILSIFKSAELTIYEKSALILIRTLSAEHDSVFPSYDTIAAMCGMSRRKAIYVIKRLADLGLISKESRGKKSGSFHDKTNEYSAKSAPDAPFEHAPDAPEGISFKPVIKTEEETNIAAPARDSNYLPFEYEIEKHGVPSEIRAAILDYIASFGTNIRNYSHKAIANAFNAAMYRIKRGAIDNVPKWIAVAIRNESFKLNAKKADKPAWSDVLERAKKATAHLA